MKDGSRRKVVVELYLVLKCFFGENFSILYFRLRGRATEAHIHPMYPNKGVCLHSLSRPVTGSRISLQMRAVFLLDSTRVMSAKLWKVVKVGQSEQSKHTIVWHTSFPRRYLTAWHPVATHTASPSIVKHEICSDTSGPSKTIIQRRVAFMVEQ